MSRVDFYHDAADKFVVAARLANKGMAAGLRVLVAVPDAETGERIDRLLWTYSPQSFVAHALADTPLSDESPVVIANRIPDDATRYFSVLINLCDTVPGSIDGFSRIVEIVSLDDTDKTWARTRFKAYREIGCELVAHRLGQDE